MRKKEKKEHSSFIQNSSAALFKRVQNWTQTKCLNRRTDKEVIANSCNRMRHSKEKEKLPPHQWMNLTVTMLNKRSQTENRIYSMIPFI